MITENLNNWIRQKQILTDTGFLVPAWMSQAKKHGLNTVRSMLDIAWDLIQWSYADRYFVGMAMSLTAIFPINKVFLNILWIGILMPCI